LHDCVLKYYIKKISTETNTLAMPQDGTLIDYDENDGLDENDG